MNRSRWIRFGESGAVLALCLAVIAGCGGSGEEAPAGSDPSPEAAGTPAPEADSAGLSIPEGATGAMGTVLFEGEPPERTVLETEGDPKCYAMHLDDPLLSDDTVVSEDGGVQWSFVYVKNPPEKDYSIPEEPAVLDQVACRYTPHVLGLQVGQELSIRNSDETLHNVRAIARENDPFNLGQPASTPPRVKKFDTPEMAIRMKCDVHPWMTAYIFALEHPFFDTTDENGKFVITGLPAGEYTLVAWHEVWGEQEATVSVTDGEMSEATFTFRAADEG